VVEVAPLSDAQRQGLRVGDRIAGPAAALLAPLGAATSLQVLGCNGARRTLSIRHEQANWPPPHPAFEWRTLNAAPGFRLGYIRADRFDDGDAELADQALAELKDTDGVVIDIRRNSGGNISAMRLASYFSGDSKRALALLARPYLQALGRPVTKADLDKLPAVHGAYTDAAIFAAVQAGRGAAVYATDDLGAKRYRGKVVVVMGKETASAAEGFAWMMKAHTAATLIGRPTAGATSAILRPSRTLPCPAPPPPSAAPTIRTSRALSRS
jgi:carboxyl-terminal processing protease